MEQQNQLEEFVEKDKISSKRQIFGPFLKLIKLTGLDCSALARYRNGKGNRCLAYSSHVVAIGVIVTMIYRIATYMGVNGKPLSFAWSESNIYGFMAIQAVVCSFCLYGWTKNQFISKFLKQFDEVKLLRTSTNETVDDYSGTHKKCVIFPIPYFVFLMASAIFVAIQQKVTFAGKEVSQHQYLMMPCLMFLTWLIVCLTLIIYNLVHSALNREIELFNEDIQKASDDKTILDYSIISSFSHRQSEIVKLVKTTNESLGGYAKIAPLFCFFSLISAIYNLSFSSVVPQLYFFCLIGQFISIIAIIIISLKPPTTLQDHLTTTSKILMLNQQIEQQSDVRIYQTYRIIVDRSLNYDTKLYLVNGFPITTSSFNVAMFIVPNLGPCLMLLKQLLEANGIKVNQ